MFDALTNARYLEVLARAHEQLTTGVCDGSD